MAVPIPAPGGDERLGDCPSCGASNSYLNTKCEGCGKRLPWGVAVARREKSREATSENPSKKNLFMPPWAILLLSLGLPLFGIVMLVILFERHRALAILCGLAALAGWYVAFVVYPLLAGR